MIRIFAIALLVLFCASTASAAEITLIQSGTKYFLVSKDANGNVVTRPVTVQLWNLDSTPVIPPIDPVDPLVPTLGSVVRAATDKVIQAEPAKTNTKTAIAKLYRTVAGLGVTSPAQLIQATDSIFTALNLPPAWVAWKKDVDKAVSVFTNLEDVKKAWVIIAISLEA